MSEENRQTTYTLTFKDKGGKVLHKSGDLPLVTEADMPGTLAAHYIMDNADTLKDEFAVVVRKRSDREEAEEFSHDDVLDRIKALKASSTNQPQNEPNS